MKEEEKWKFSVISNKYPTYRDISLKTVYSWLDGKRVDDNAEGLWRIHNVLYDFSSFTKLHPGGSFWLEKTKGTDITEAFESHHISNTPEKMLERFRIRNAEKPRNMIFTFNDDGFYRTLKQRVRDKLKVIDKGPIKKTEIIHSILLAVTILASILSASTQNYRLAALTGLFLSWTIIAAHNFFHQRDNWRMLTFNLSLMNFSVWRISHALSHHLYTNSYHDLELSMFEPFLCWIPSPYLKTIVQRYISWIYGPLIIYPLIFVSHIILRILYSLTNHNVMRIDDLIGFVLPLLMFVFSGQMFFNVLKIWLAILIYGSLIFGIIGLNAAHHHPKIYHDGDEIRKDHDWGLFQLDAVMDRADIKGSQFLTLTHFGDHALHHLFPTLDHGILPQLYPILYETIMKFEVEVRECSWFQHIIGQHLQLARIISSKIPPDEQNKECNCD